MRNQQCRLTELHKFCSVFYFLGDYESVGNPTNASGDRLAKGALRMFVRGSSVGLHQSWDVNAGFPGGICQKAFAHFSLITSGNRRWTC